MRFVLAIVLILIAATVAAQPKPPPVCPQGWTLDICTHECKPPPSDPRDPIPLPLGLVPSPELRVICEVRDALYQLGWLGVEVAQLRIELEEVKRRLEQMENRLNKLER